MSIYWINYKGEQIIMTLQPRPTVNNKTLLIKCRFCPHMDIKENMYGANLFSRKEGKHIKTIDICYDCILKLIKLPKEIEKNNE